MWHWSIKPLAGVEDLYEYQIGCNKGGAFGSVQGIGLGKALLGVVLVSWRPQSETDSP